MTYPLRKTDERIGRIARPIAATPVATIYGYVRIDFSAAGNPDHSECELCNADGSRITTGTVTGFINYKSGIPLVSFDPSTWYILQKNGTRSITGIGTRDLYTIIGVGGYGASSAVWEIKSVGSGNNFGEPCNSAGTAITQTISGAANPHTVSFYNPTYTSGLPVSSRYDLASPLQWKVATTGIPYLQLDWFNRLRTGYQTNNGNVGSMSIDMGERFYITWTVSYTSGNSTFGGNFIRGNFSGRSDFSWDGGSLYVVGTGGGFESAIHMQTPPTISTADTHAFSTQQGPTLVTLGSASDIWDIPVGWTAGESITANFTQDGTTLRLTAVTLAVQTITSCTSTIKWAVNGGRDWNGWGLSP